MKKILISLPGYRPFYLTKLLMIMKLTTVLLFLKLLTLSAIGLSQPERVTVRLSNAELKDLVNVVEKQTSYKFLYRDDQVSDLRVNVNEEDIPLDQLLIKCLAGSEFSYKILQNNLIVITSGDIIQQLTITGKVTDSETGDPMPGVNIQIKGKSYGTITDAGGKYELSVTDRNEILIFSFIGYIKQEISLDGRITLDIALLSELKNLDEVVVVGYGVQKKVSLTGSIGTIKADNMTQRPVANTTDLLQGQITGLVTRQSSGLPGSDGTILNIRGFGDPLILVDGITSTLAQVDPNDIESVSVLKDAAAAVYGARAGNGVILVTTKRGRDKPSQISYHGSAFFVQPTFLAGVVNAGEWAEMISESGLNPDDYSPNFVHYDPASNTLINKMDGSTYEGYNWPEALYRSWTPQQQHNLSATGGTDRIKYFISGGFTDQESNFKSGDYDFSRFNIRSNIDASISDNLAVSVDFAYRRTFIDRANFTVAEVFNSINHAKPVYPYIHEADPSRATYPGTYNSPYYELFRKYSGFIENRENVITGAFEIKYTFRVIKGLIAKARINFEDLFSWDKNVSKPINVFEYDPIAAEAGTDPWILTGTTKNTNKMSVYSARSNELLPFISLEYDRTAGQHSLRGMIIGETSTYKGTSLQGDRKNILSYETPYLNNASAEGIDNAESSSQRARSSIIGRVNYDYRSKYFLEAAIRADASAEYPPRGRWGYFPSISAGWRISEEQFIKNKFSFINNIKLRGSFGILGNDAISSFDYLTGYIISGDYYIFGTTPASAINSAGLANPDITWETMKISNIGLDGDFWNSKLGFEIDVFYRLRENILATPVTQVPNTFGASLPRINLNKSDNRGFEISVNHKNKIGDFYYDISPGISWSRGKFVDWDENILPVDENMDEASREFNILWNKRYLNEHQWDDNLWGLISDGFFMNQQEIDEYPVNQDQNGNQTIKVGDIKYKDINGDNYIDWRDEQVIGKSGLPKIMYNLDMGARLRNLNLRLLWQGGAGYSVSFQGDAAAPFSNESIPLKVHYRYRAITASDENGHKYITNPDDFRLPPVTQNGLTSNNSKKSDFWTYDAHFLRMKNFYLSYTLPNKFTGKAGINECIFYMSGTNLLTRSNLGIWKKIFDPEITVQGNRSYPPVKTVTLGLRLTI